MSSLPNPADESGVSGANGSNQIKYDRAQEITNRITHLVGAALSIFGAAFLLVQASLDGADAVGIVAISRFMTL